MLRPVWPFSSINLNLSFVSFASPNPEYWRMVQNLSRYIPGWIPLVNGYLPESSAALLFEDFL